MFLVRSTLQLIVVSCLAALLAQCADDQAVYNKRFATFPYRITDEYDKVLCYGAFLERGFILTEYGCVQNIDLKNVEVKLGDKSETVDGGPNTIVATRQMYGLEISYLRTDFKNSVQDIVDTPLCEKRENSIISECYIKGNYISFIDYDEALDFTKYIRASMENEYLDLQLNMVRRRGVYESQSSENVYYENMLAIKFANYIVQVKHKSGLFLCAGALVTPDVVVTAADCFIGSVYVSIEVVAGSASKTQEGFKREIARLTIPPAYNSETGESNLAVVQLTNPFSTGKLGIETVGTIPLCKNPLKENDYVKVSGWSNDYQTYTYSLQISYMYLASTTLPVMVKEKCYNDHNVTADQRIFCAEITNFKRPVLDFGGPAIFNGELCGIATNKKTKGSYKFVDLYYFRDFIDNVINTTNVARQSVEGKPHVSKPQTSKANLYSPIKIKDVPYLVQLRHADNDTFSCAGVLISNDTVLTATGCVSNVVVVAGADTLTEDGVRLQIDGQISNLHSNFGAEISLMKLKEPLSDKDLVEYNIAIVQIYDGSINENEYLRVVGWRHMSTDNPDENKLTTTFIRATSIDTCRNDILGRYTEREACAVGNDYDNQFMVSDEGGPVLRGSKLVGIVTGCFNCVDTNYITKLVVVSFFRNLIKEGFTKIN